MRKINLAVLSALVSLAACANNKALELGEEPGNYVFPINKDKWAYTAFGFYVSRDTTFSDEIEYEAIVDMRQIRMEYLTKYDTTENFKKTYPSFVRYKGKTDCGKNTVTVDQLDAVMREIYSKVETQPNDVSRALCTLKQMTKDK